MTGLNIAYQLIPCSIHVIKPDQWPMISSLEKKWIRQNMQHAVLNL